MPKWIPCNGTFSEGDIYKWEEPAWKPRQSKKSKPRMIGKKHIVAQLIRRDGDWLFFTLMECRIEKADDWWKPILNHEKGETLKRSRRVLMKKNLERRERGSPDGESARAITASKYLR